MNCGFQAALFDELELLYPDSRIEDGARAHTIAAASNTFAGVHILLSGLTPGKFVTLEAFGPIKKSTASHGDTNTINLSLGDHRYKFFELIPLPVEVNTGARTRTEWTNMDVNLDVARRAPFMVYDVLKPCTNVLNATGAVMGIAFRALVDAQVREAQRWELIVTHDGVSHKLTLLIEVFPVKVGAATKEDHKYVNWIGGKAISAYHHVEMLSDEWFEIYEKYMRLAHYGRQNIANPTAEMVFTYDGEHTPRLNEKLLDRLMALYDKLGYYWIEGPHLAGRRDNEWMATEAETVFSRQVIPGEGEAELSDMSAQLYAYIKKHGYEDRWLQSVMDEPIDCLADTFRLETDIVKRSMPGIPILEATIATQSIAGTLDIWCPTVDEYERHREFFDGRVALGDQVYVYTCLNPAGNYLNRLLDQERLRPLLLGWAPTLYPNVTGYLHWGGMNLFGMDPYCLSAPLPDITDYTTRRQSSLPAGDPAIMYPGFREAYSTTRLEAQRMGLEDQVLLDALRQKDAAEAEQLVRSVFRAYDDYTKDVREYRAARRRLLIAAG